jgi:hypothetical protein
MKGMNLIVVIVLVIISCTNNPESTIKPISKYTVNNVDITGDYELWESYLFDETGEFAADSVVRLAGTVTIVQNSDSTFLEISDEGDTLFYQVISDSVSDFNCLYIEGYENNQGEYVDSTVVKGVVLDPPSAWVEENKYNILLMGFKFVKCNLDSNSCKRTWGVWNFVTVQ